VLSQAFIRGSTAKGIQTNLIRGGMVQVVLVLPPCNAEALAEVPEEEATCVVDGPVGKNLVVQEVVR